MQKEIANFINDTVSSVAGSATKIDKFYVNTIFDYKNELNIEANGQVSNSSDTYTYELTLTIKKEVK